MKVFVDELEQRLTKTIEDKIGERIRELHERLDTSMCESCEIKERLEAKEKQTKELEDILRQARDFSKKSMRKVNYNKQYSRKNNIKIMGLVERPNENTESLSNDFCSFLLVKVKVILKAGQIVAVQRIPGKVHN